MTRPSYILGWLLVLVTVFVGLSSSPVAALEDWEVRFALERRVQVINDTFIWVGTSGNGSEVTFHNESDYIYRWVNDWTWAVKELDADVELWIEPLNPVRARFMFRNGENRTQDWTEVPVWACVNGTEINRFRRYEVNETPYCNYGTMYRFDVPVDEWITINWNQHPEPSEFWYADGGGLAGDGLPTCEGIEVIHLQNQTETFLNSTYRNSGRANYLSSPAGCTLYILKQQQNRTSDDTWADMSDTDTSLFLTHCTASKCSVSSPSLSTTYFFYPMCDTIGGTGDLRTRIAVFADVNGVFGWHYSGAKFHTCKPLITAEEAQGAWLTLFTIMLIITTLVVAKEVKKNA